MKDARCVRFGDARGRRDLAMRAQVSRGHFARASFLLVLCLIPLVAVGIAMLTKPWAPTGDLGLIDLRSRDMFSLHPPLTGLVSRRGWNHPGPAQFYLLAPFAAIGTDRPEVLRQGWILLEIMIVTAAIVLAAQVGRALAWIAALTVALSYLALPPSAFWMPWNPWMPVPMLMLLLVLVIRVAAGRLGDLLGIAIVGTVMTQIHAGTMPIALGLGATALSFAYVDARRTQTLRRLGLMALWSLGVCTALWIPPALGAIFGVPGNVTVLAKYFLEAPDPPLGIVRALRILGGQFAWRPAWLGGTIPAVGSQAIERSALLAVLPFVALGLGGLVARLSRWRLGERIVVIAGVALLLGIAAISRVDVPFGYTFEWRGVLATFVLVAAVAPGVRVLARSWGQRSERAIVAVVALALVAMVVAAVPRLVHRSSNEDLQVKAAVSIRDALARGPSIKGRKILVPETAPNFSVVFLRLGLIDAIDAYGGKVRGPVGERAYSTGRAMGTRRAASARSVDEVWTLAVGDAQIADALSRSRARLVWRSPAKDREAREMARLRGLLADQMAQVGRRDLTPLLDSIVFDPRLSTVPGLDPRVGFLIDFNYRSVWEDPCRCAIVATPGD